MRLGALAVHVDDGMMDGCFEVIGIGERPVGEIVTLQVTPGAFNLVQFRCIFGQPLDCEPGAGGEPP